MSDIILLQQELLAMSQRSREYIPRIAKYEELKQKIMLLDIHKPVGVSLKEIIYCIIYYNGIWPKCKICNKLITTPLHLKRKMCQNRECICTNIKIEKQKISKDQQAEITHKRIKTCIERYNKGSASSTLSGKTYWNQIKTNLDNIDTYSPEETHELFISDQYYFEKYFGRSKNRTLYKDNAKLYKSLFVHTEFIKKYTNKKIPFVLRLYVAGKYNFQITNDILCLCGSKFTFLERTQKFDGMYCRKCMPPMNSKEHYKHKYKYDWENKWNENVLRMRSFMLEKIKNNETRKITKNDNLMFPCIGKNEKFLLDQQEAKYNCKIDRDFMVSGFYPDGYCHETNTIYEVYEKHHKYTTSYDTLRCDIIKKKLNCEIKIIYDGWSP